ncbi:MAG: Asp23/Gls24 family envelope stress response protein [Coprococcus sp.]
MANERENNTNYTIYENGSLGEVQIADEVVAIIAGIAATEVEGVAAMAGNIQKEFISKLGMKVLSKGVRISVEEGNVSVDLSIILDYGYSIPGVTKDVQEKVKNAIETMTGLSVADVNIRVADVKIDNE